MLLGIIAKSAAKITKVEEKKMENTDSKMSLIKEDTLNGIILLHFVMGKFCPDSPHRIRHSAEEPLQALYVSCY